MSLTDEELRAAMGQLDLAEGMTSDALSTFFCSFVTETVSAGTVLLAEGATNTRLFVLLAGRLAVTLPATSERPEPFRLGEMNPVEAFGEYSIYDGQPVSATVVAEHDAQIAWIEKPAIDAFVDGHPQAGRCFYDNLLTKLVGKLRDKDARLDLITIG